MYHPHTGEIFQPIPPAESVEVKIPVTEGVIQEAVDFMAGRRVGLYVQATEDLGIPSGMDSLVKGHSHVPYRYAISAGANYFLGLNIEADDAEKACVEDFVRNGLGEELANDAWVQRMSLDILATMEKVRSVRNYVDVIMSPIGESIYEYPGLQFNFMKLIADGSDSTDSATERDQISTLQTLYFFDRFDVQHPSTFPELGSQLQEGVYDAYIAAELLGEVYDDKSQLSNGQEDLRNLLTIYGGSGFGDGAIDGVILGLSSDEIRPAWPLACKRLLEDRRQQYWVKLANQAGVSKKFLEERDCVLPRNHTDETVDRAMHNYVLGVWEARRKSATIPLDRVRAGRQVVALTARRQRQDEVAKQAAEAKRAAAESQETVVEQRKLVYVTPSGEEIEESDSLRIRTRGDLFADFLAANHSNPKLESDLKRLAELLKIGDFSEGLPRGIYKTNNGDAITYGGRRFSEVYELNAQKAQVSMQSPNGHKLRVFFVRLDSETVGVLDVCYKKDMERVLARLGVKGKAQRKA